MADGGSCMIHALAFNTLLSSQETDAYTITRTLRPGPELRGFHLVFYFTSFRCLDQIK
ncbi:hypothetical protein BJ982_002665 [Sphaerisporangium siamense]|uniref:Uncharacterized protein n=1 Tax=Sphaerisporangium siamense TaxID=795645 RepID=A0A7W7D8Y8_9ACTN|nr:hypothetical protein [Sphaerisporangium siamense]